MDLNELMNKHPQIYAEAVQKGVEQEKDRVTAHITMGEAANCMDLAVKNIKEGNGSTATVNAEYMAEGMKKNDVNNRNVDDQNLQNVNTNGSDDDVTTDEEQAAYEAKLNKRMGVK